MKRKNLAVLATFGLVLFLFAVNSFAQGMMWRGSNGWGWGSQYYNLYNAKTLETISGEVVSVENFIPMMGMSNGIQMIVKTDKETINVHLGPQWYLENQDIQFAPKDKVEVKGSRINFRGQPIIMASEIKKGNTTLLLWNQSGYPMWNGCMNGTWY